MRVKCLDNVRARWPGLAVVCWLTAVGSGFASAPVMRLAAGTESGVELLRNGTFEEAPAEELPNWAAAPRGFEVAIGQGRNGSHALHCRNDQEKGWYGASQTIVLDRTNIYPLVVRGW